MSKTLFLWLLVSVLATSCQKKQDAVQEDITSKINTISVIIDDQLWNSEVGDSIRNKFASPVLGLPQEEPLFTIKQFPLRLFEGFSTGSRNTIVIKKDTNSKYIYYKYKSGLPQNSFQFSGKNTVDIISLLEDNYPKIVSTMRETEIRACQEKLLDSLQDIAKIKEKFNIEINIPNEYEYVKRRRNFIWLKKEITSGNCSLLIYQIPFESIKTNSEVDNIVKIRDSVGRLYIHSKGNRSSMITEEAYYPYFSEMKWNDYIVYETKGNWEIKNEFMSGPFINYAIKDKVNNRILILEGFCYAPSKEKRDLMFELESIIRTVKIPNKK